MEREIRLESLYLDYGKERLRNWCCSLNKFRFFKSHPYPDDLTPDRFIALTKFKDENELQHIINLLKIELNIKNQDVSAIESVFYEEVIVNEVSCFIEINKVLKNLVLVVSGSEQDQFSLDDSTFLRAKKIDNLLSELEIEFISSPYNDDYCITPEFYPEIWQ